MVDAATILTFVLSVVDGIGNIFLLIMGCIAVWMTFAYKLQKHMVYVPLVYEQEWSFVAYVISATALKGVGLFYTYLNLIFTETFFVGRQSCRYDIAGLVFRLGKTQKWNRQIQRDYNVGHINK